MMRNRFFIDVTNVAKHWLFIIGLIWAHCPGIGNLTPVKQLFLILYIMNVETWTKGNLIEW